jgi:type I restriction enzyme S subunit
MVELRTVRIGDLGRVVTGKTPPSSRPELFGDLHPFLTPTDIDGFARYIEPTRFLSPEGRDYQHRLMLPERAVCVVCIGATIGKVCMTGRPSFTNQQINSVVANENEHDPFFVYHLMTTLRDKLKSNAGGAATPIINKTAFSEIEVHVPPRSMQRRVAGILSAYEELMENCQRRIRLLEAMARALYREWFVHFRFPGCEAVEFVETQFGRVPDGWVLPFANHVDFKEGPGLRNWQYRNEGLPFLNIRTLVDNDIDLSKVQFLDPKEVEEKYQHFLLREHDHVVSSSGTIGRIGTIRAEHLPLMLNTSIIRMRPQGKRMGCWLLKHFMLSEYFQNQAMSFATGAAQANFGPIHLKQMEIIAPDEHNTAEYERLVAPMELAIMSLARRIQNLRRTRDLLLPRLLSGQVELT